MKYTFGIELDGWRSVIPTTRLNAVTGGLRMLVDQLELRLGLPHPLASHPRRVACYRKALESVSNASGRFFAVSFAKDPLATAEVLLSWRDELIMAGWGQQNVERAPARIRDFAAVEACAESEVRSGYGDRINRLLSTLGNGAAVPMEVTVIDERKQLPHLLGQLLEKLGAVFEARGQFPLATEGSNLRRAQEALLGLNREIVWNGSEDDSLTVCTAFSEMTLAQVAANWLASESRGADGGTRLLLTTSDPSPLVAALRGLDEPVPDGGSTSVQRPILQLLRLAFRLRWQPLNPTHLLEFLVHPVSPLPAHLRRRLAEVVADQPGIGGRGWQQAVAEAKELAKRWEKENGEADEDIERRMRDWLLVARYDPALGAPSEALAETCKNVRRWALGRMAKEAVEDEAMEWQSLAAVALEVSELLEGRETVKLTELEQMLSLAEGQGTTRGKAPVELGAIPTLNDPAAVLESVSELFWWSPARPAALPMSPWTRAEREALAGLGVMLPVARTLIESRRAAAMLPLLAATKRVRLFLPKKHAGEVVEHHPLLDELQAFAGGPIPMIDIDAMMSGGRGVPGVVSKPCHSLPGTRRWWKLSDPKLLYPRKSESFSSISQFVFQPFAWVLKYRAKLDAGPVGSYSIAADARQRGNLMHHITEQLFESPCSFTWQSESKDKFHEWLHSIWTVLLETEGANLLLPGARTDAERLRQETQRAIWQLITHLRAAGVTEARADVEPERAPFRNNATLMGRIDLVVKRDALPATAVIDLKYGGREWRRKELAQNMPLQLAVYSYLLASENGGDWPQTAYFILSDRQLLAQNSDYFADGNVVPMKGVEPGPKACWNDFLRVWDWRRAQLDDGWIEVPVAGADTVEGEPETVPPDPRWVQDLESERYDGFESLTGWEEGA
jgi:hypothetical protein